MRLPQSQLANDRATAEKLLNHLRSSTYLASDAELENFYFSVYEQGRIRPEGLAAMDAAFGDSLMVFRSTNFSNSIGDRVPEWKKSAQSGCAK